MAEEKKSDDNDALDSSMEGASSSSSSSTSQPETLHDSLVRFLEREIMNEQLKGARVGDTTPSSWLEGYLRCGL